MSVEERRESKRYRVKSGIAALMMADRSQIATIIDISRVGLAFVCPSCDVPEMNRLEMDILLLDDVVRPDNDIFFSGVQGVIVATGSFADILAYPYQSMSRCSVRFNDALPLESYPLLRFSPDNPEEGWKNDR